MALRQTEHRLPWEGYSPCGFPVLGDILGGQGGCILLVAVEFVLRTISRFAGMITKEKFEGSLSLA